jgi:hypothetical protein
MIFLNIARAAGFFGVLAIIVLSLVPGTYRPHTGLPGVAEHFIAYCSTAFAFALGFRSSASRVVIALALTLLAGSGLAGGPVNPRDAAADKVPRHDRPVDG